MSKISNNRTRLLASVSTAVAAVAMSTAGGAATTVVSPINPADLGGTTANNGTDLPVNGNTHDGVGSLQLNVSQVLARVQDTLNGIGVGDQDNTTQTTVTVEANEVAASAAGNIFANSINLSVTENDEDGDGVAALGVSTNAGPVRGEVQNNEIRAGILDFESGSVSVSDNSITGDASGNRGSTSLAGSIPNAYASPLSGSSNLDSSGVPVDSLTAAGSLLASTLQVNVGEVSSTVGSDEGDGNEISLDLISTEGLTFTAAPTVNDNVIGSSARGNASSSTIDLQLDPGSGGAAPTFAGSAVVTNGQANSAGILATNDSSFIGATIVADDVDEEGYINALAGSLSVDGNTISASASGNEALGTSGQAGNRILLANGLSFQGQGEGPANVGAGYDSGDAFSSANADLIINNSQGNFLPGLVEERLTVSAQVNDSLIGGDVQALGDFVLNGEAGGSVSVSDNAVTATARGNAASSAVASGDNSALFSGSVAVANQQINYNTNVSAVNSDSEITAYVDSDQDGLLQGSAVAVGGNTQSAAAYGNQVSQSAALAAAVVDLSANGIALTGGTGNPEGNVSATGGAIVSSLQTIYDSSVLATLDDAWTSVEVNADFLRDSSVSVDGNTQEAIAVGSSGSNALSVESTNLTGGAGILSVQIADNAVDIGADASVEASVYAVDVISSSIDVTGNLARAVAYGGSVSNTLNVNAQTIGVVESDVAAASIVTFDAFESFVLDNSSQPSLNAAYGVLNIQSTSADVSANLRGWDDAYANAGIYVDGAISNGSSLANEDNSSVAAAYGNQAVNSGGRRIDGTIVPMIDAGVISLLGEDDEEDEGYASVLNVTNAQTLTRDSSVTATAAGALVETFAGTNVENSSVSTSNNAVQALAYGNLVTNEAMVEATNINTGSSNNFGGSAVDIPAGDIVASVFAPFSVNNVQAASGSITASLVDNLEDPSSATTISTVVGAFAFDEEEQGNVFNSAVVSNGNKLTAGATGNAANNLLGISATTLTTGAALLNSQTSQADLTARIGILGGVVNQLVEEGTPNSTFGYSYTTLYNLSGQCASGSCPVSSAYDSIDLEENSFTDDQYDYLINNGWTETSGTLTRTVAGVTSIPSTDIFGVPGSASGIELNDGTPSLYADVFVPNQGGVSVAVLGDVVGSTIAVNGNTIAGSVTGNSANNTLAVDATSAANVNNQFGTQVELGNLVNSEISEVIADYSLNNVQFVGGQFEDENEINSEVYGSLAIDLNYGPNTTIENSTLTVDGNVQSSRAVANTAANKVDFSATNSTAGSALASFQAGSAAVGALSDLDIYVPVSGSGSSVSVSDNTNLALAVSNDVTNELIVSGTNLNPVGVERDVSLVSGNDVVAAGDHILANQQITTNSVIAAANTTIWNDDYRDDEAAVLNTGGISSSAVKVANNLTIAEATANRATNVATVSAGAALSASAGVANFQSTSGEMQVSATASTNASVFLGTAEDPLFNPAVNGSSVTLGQNTTSSLARGNSAINALNFSAGSNYGGTTEGSDPYTALNVNGDSTVAARAGLLNSQTNGAAVTANSINTSYVVALNSVEAPTFNNATVGVIGNTVSAGAYGNTASNKVTVAALNTNAASAAIGNVQFNSGPVTATVTSVNYGITSGVGATSGSALSVTGNSITATAVGNNAVSSLIGN